MGIGNIFVATTLAPLVVVLASMSLNLLLLGMETIKRYSSHSYSKSAFFPVVRKLNFLINTKCFGETDVDPNNFQNVLLMAILMALVGVALSVSQLGDKTAEAARAPSKSKTKNGGTSGTAKSKTK